MYEFACQSTDYILKAIVCSIEYYVNGFTALTQTSLIDLREDLRKLSSVECKYCMYSVPRLTVLVGDVQMTWVTGGTWSVCTFKTLNKPRTRSFGERRIRWLLRYFFQATIRRTGSSTFTGFDKQLSVCRSLTVVHPRAPCTDSFCRDR